MLAASEGSVGSLEGRRILLERSAEVIRGPYPWPRLLALAALRGAVALSGVEGSEESLLAWCSGRRARFDVLMLGARAMDGPDGVELKKDQLRLAVSGAIVVLGENVVFASADPDSESSDGFLAGAGRVEGVMRLWLAASLDVDATGTSNMSRACS